MAGRVPPRVRAWCRGDRPRAPRGTGRATWAGRLAAGGGVRDPAAPPCARHARARGHRSDRTCLRGGYGQHRAAPLRGARDRAAGRRRAGLGGRSCSVGQRQRRNLRPAAGPDRGRSARPGRAGRRRAREGLGGDRQSVPHDPADRLPAGLSRPAGTRPVRPDPAVRRERPGPSAVRRGEHPADGPRAGPAPRPLPLLDRAPRDDARIRIRGPSLAAAVPGGTSRTAAGRVLQGRVDAGSRRDEAARSGPARRRPGPALDGAPDGRGAAPPVP